MEDADAVATLNDEVQHMHFVADSLEYNRPDHAASLAYFKAVLEDGVLLILLAQRDGVDAGYLVAKDARRPASPFRSAADFLYVHQVGVCSRLRRMGVGTALFNEAERIARESGLVGVRLDTGTFNQTARDFFRNLGFEMFGIRIVHRL